MGRSGVNFCKKNNAYNLCRLISVLQSCQDITSIQEQISKSLVKVEVVPRLESSFATGVCVCVLVPGTNQVLDPLETQVTGSCEMPNLSAGNRSLQGQCVLLIIEPFLWPPWRQAEHCFALQH